MATNTTDPQLLNEVELNNVTEPSPTPPGNALHNKNVIPKTTFIIVTVTLIIIILGLIIGIIIIGLQLSNTKSNENMENITKTPKNIILFIGDGMGTSQHAVYRRWQKISKTILDKHYLGRYDVTSVNHTVTDSANGAYAISTGNLTTNGFIGVDKHGNPQANIAQAAKLAYNKGIGIITTTNIYDATPAEFCCHALTRKFYSLIAKQQSMLNKDKLMVDILWGGGKQYFIPNNITGGKRNDGFDIRDNYKNGGWNTYIENNNSLNMLTINDLPNLGLFSLAEMPYYLDRKTDNNGILPNIIDMVKKSIQLLSEKYKNEGFLIMVESARIDHCGHANDIVCMLNEMSEYHQVSEYLYNWAKNDGNTLFINLADHETGGVSIGRSIGAKKDSVIKYFPSTNVNNLSLFNATNNARYYDPLVPYPINLINDTTRVDSYHWLPEHINYSKHTSQYIGDFLINDTTMDINSVINVLENNYLQNMDDTEIQYITDCWNAYITTDNNDFYGVRACISQLINWRTYTGFTTHGHTGADCSIYGYGPGIENFYGHHSNGDIGVLLNKIFKTEEMRLQYTKTLQNKFIDGTLKICDDTEKQSFFGWDYNISYPWGNLRSDYCVESWKE